MWVAETVRLSEWASRVQIGVACYLRIVHVLCVLNGLIERLAVRLAVVWDVARVAGYHVLLQVLVEHVVVLFLWHVA